MKREVMAYTMNAPYKDQPAIPSDLILWGLWKAAIKMGFPAAL